MAQLGNGNAETVVTFSPGQQWFSYSGADFSWTEVILHWHPVDAMNLVFQAQELDAWEGCDR